MSIFLCSGCIYSHMKENRKIILFTWLTLVLALLCPNGWRTQRPFDSVTLITAPRGFCFCRTKIFISPYAGTSHANQTAFRSAQFKTVTAAEVPGMLLVISVQIQTFQESKTGKGDGFFPLKLSELLLASCERCVKLHVMMTTCD